MNTTANNETMDVNARARAVRMIVFDIDGVLTDGSLFYGDDGQEYKAFNSRDGHGIKMLRASGVEAGIITGRTSQVVLHRARNLGITRIFQGADDKLTAFGSLLRDLGLSPANRLHGRRHRRPAGPAALRPGHHRAGCSSRGEGALPSGHPGGGRARRGAGSMRADHAGPRHLGSPVGPLRSVKSA